MWIKSTICNFRTESSRNFLLGESHPLSKTPKFRGTVLEAAALETISVKLHDLIHPISVADYTSVTEEDSHPLYFDILAFRNIHPI